MSDPIIPVFRTPEEVALELGMSPTELRRYCRQTGLCTRLSNRRIMLDAENIADIIAWAKSKPIVPDDAQDGEPDPFD